MQNPNFCSMKVQNGELRILAKAELRNLSYSMWARAEPVVEKNLNFQQIMEPRFSKFFLIVTRQNFPSWGNVSAPKVVKQIKQCKAFVERPTVFNAFWGLKTVQTSRFIQSIRSCALCSPPFRYRPSCKTKSTKRNRFPPRTMPERKGWGGAWSSRS